MIIRIYRVAIVPELRKSFETDFQGVAKEFMADQPGLISAEIGKPTSHSPDEYLMISKWKDLDAVKNFAGTQWQTPVIPDWMQKYTVNCWLHHFESF